MGPQTSAVTDSILAVAHGANRQRGNHIAQDCRHQDVQLPLLEEITQRRYADWAMAHVRLAEDDPMVRLNHPEFDPGTAPGAAMLQIVEDLFAAGHRIRKTSA